MDVNYHVVKDLVGSKDIVIQHYQNQDMTAYIFIKELIKPKFEQFCAELGVLLRDIVIDTN